MTGTQLPESLEDMAMYISQEWDHQDPSKRASSRDMVQDSYESMGTLEPCIPSQEVSQVEQGGKPWDPSVQTCKEGVSPRNLVLGKK